MHYLSKKFQNFKSTTYLWYKITPSFHRLPIEKDQKVEEWETLSDSMIIKKKKKKKTWFRISKSESSLAVVP
jgi:hypothetical protein